MKAKFMVRKTKRRRKGIGKINRNIFSPKQIEIHRKEQEKL